jgi:hypothetical protein
MSLIVTHFRILSILLPCHTSREFYFCPFVLLCEPAHGKKRKNGSCGDGVVATQLGVWNQANGYESNGSNAKGERLKAQAARSSGERQKKKQQKRRNEGNSQQKRRLRFIVDDGESLGRQFSFVLLLFRFE